LNVTMRRDAMPPSAPMWAVLFVASPSPGAVFRFFERRRRQDPGMPAALLLSDAVGAEAMRLLRTEKDLADDWLAAQGILLSTVFPPRITLLRREAGAWQFTTWEAGAEIEQGGGVFDPPARPSLLQRLPGARRPLSPEVTWAQSRALPLNRRTAPLLDYVTVAQLDQKSLLVENRPRLYRFVL